MKILLLALALICCAGLNAQITPTQNDTLIFKTINSEQTDFSDLMPLKEIWGNTKYILLGEQSHGEGATFEARVRLIKFLHQEMGFEIVAFESGMYDNYHAFNKVKSGEKTSPNPFNKSILSIWSATKENNELFKYVQSTLRSDNPLQIAGFDFIRNDFYKFEFLADIEALLASAINKKELSTLTEAIEQGADLLLEGRVDSVSFFDLTQKIQFSLDQLSAKNPTEHHLIMAQSFKSWVHGFRYELGERMGIEYAVQNPRDFQMAENFLFLTRLYPKKKIVGIGASYHFSNEVTKFQTTSLTEQFIDSMSKETNSQDRFDLSNALKDAIPMGKILKKELGENLYSAAFSSYKGSYGQIGNESYKLPEPPGGSIEIQLKDIDFAFVDYSKNEGKDDWFYSSVLGNLPIFAQWRSIFDGLFFIKTAYPPTPISYDRVTKIKSAKKGIYGIVVDSESGERIPFVNISLEGTAKGTTSNEIGSFVYNSAIEKQQKLIFSSIGYENDTISLDGAVANDLVVSLKPKRYLLQEIIITDKPLTAKDIIRLAQNHRDDNYYQKPLNQEFYFSSTTFLNNDSISFNEEAAVMVYGENGYKSSNSVASHFYGDIIHMRNTTGNPSKDRWYGVGSLWKSLGHNIIFDKANVLHRTNFYELELLGVVNFEDQLVYEIGFDCKSPNASTVGYGYPAPEAASGKIYINTSDYAIVKYEICVSRKKSLIKKKDIELYPYGHRLIQTFKRYNGKYFLSTSYNYNHYTYTNLKNKRTWSSGDLSILNSINIEIESPKVIEKPIQDIAIGRSFDEDLNFWNSFNYLVQPDVKMFDCYSLTHSFTE